MKKKGRYESFAFGFVIILVCMFVITTGGSDIVSDQTERQIQQSSPPLPPGYEGDFIPQSEEKIDGKTMEMLTLDSNQLQLYPGWNMISIPLWLQSGSNTASVVFAGVDTAGHSTFYYNAQTQMYIPIYPSTEIIPLEGIWIYSADSELITLNYAASQTIRTKQLYTGWNLIGVWHLYAHSARDTLISVSQIWSYGYGYNAESQLYENSIVNGGSGSHSDSQPMYPGKGYWLYCTGNGMLIPLAGTKDHYDSSYPQVGVEWVNNYQITPLSMSDNVAIDFYTILGNAGWVPMFENGDSEAQNGHFTIGDDWRYIDGVDIALFAGHGTWNWIRFIEPNVALFNTCEWGDNDLEWIFLHGCHTTQELFIFKSLPNWAMNGVHLVCGYCTEGWDNQDDGFNLANYLITSHTVKQSWFTALDITEPEGRILRVIGENPACGNDYIWGEGSVISDPPVDATVSYWLYYCTG